MAKQSPDYFDHRNVRLFGEYSMRFQPPFQRASCRLVGTGGLCHWGEGVVVELDESKLGKRKYERGHRVEGVWVVGGIERTEAKRTFIVTVENRSAAALLGIIHRHVLPGSIVFTDMWKGYAGITEVLNLEHRTVNHSVEYVSEDGTHTNIIEATWCGLKLLVPKRNRTKDVEGFLWEYMWRKKNRGRLWTGLIEALKVVAYE